MVNDGEKYHRDIRPGEDPELDAQKGEGTQARITLETRYQSLNYYIQLLQILDPNNDYTQASLEEQDMLLKRIKEFSETEIKNAKNQIIKPSKGAPDPTPEEHDARERETAINTTQYLIGKYIEKIIEINPDFVYADQDKDQLKAIYEDLRRNR